MKNNQNEFPKGRSPNGQPPITRKEIYGMLGELGSKHGDDEKDLPFKNDPHEFEGK